MNNKPSTSPTSHQELPDYDRQAKELLQKHGGDLMTACSAYLDSVDILSEGMKQLFLAAIKFQTQKITTDTSMQNARRPLTILLKEIALVRQRLAGDEEALEEDLIDAPAIAMADQPYPDKNKDGQNPAAPIVLRIVKDTGGNAMAFFKTEPTLADRLITLAD